MKKRLESELISIAHRILKLKNKSEVDQLYKETQKLYETLAILKFYQDNFESVKSEVSSAVLEERLEQSNQVESVTEPVTEVKAEVVEVVPEAESEETQPESSDSEQAEQIEESQPETEDDSSDSEQEKQIEAAVEEESKISEEPEKTVEEELEEEPTQEEEEVVVEEKPSFEPNFELEEEEQTEDDTPAEVAFEVQPKEKLEDHIGMYADPVFVKPNEVSLFPSEIPAETREEIKAAMPSETHKTSAGNDGMSKSIAIGLNDRIGFVQHLFNDSNEDFNRVISQLNTFDTFEEAKNFINEMVIPDYNYWVGEEDYIERFMEIVEKKFQ